MGRPSEVPPPRPNLLRKIGEIREPAPLSRQASAPKGMPPPPKRTNRQTCPNKECEYSMIEDGVCHTCGTVVDDSNIVAEVQFGESSTGAAVVQGSYVGADQGGARSTGPGFKRGGEGGDRESTVREGRRLMTAMGNALKIQDSTVTCGVQIFKMAAINNFIQGRRMDMVAAVCLYSACRKEKPCRVMLIDFADRTQVNVFKLGRTFKALHKEITLSADGLQPVLPEDLIYRFAQKLEFGEQTARVAEDAVRLVQRMSLDWMVMGRRPSGVCGACLIMAARMNNFRRTVTEVVYIVKVNTATIQKRLEEFKQLPSSALTVEEFLTNAFLESTHDPPSFYEKTEEFQKAKKARKRKRRGEDIIDLVENGDTEGDDVQRPKRRKSVEAASSNTTAVGLRRDADGDASPLTPDRLNHSTLPTPPATQVEDTSNIDPAILSAETNANTSSSTLSSTTDTFEALVSEIGALLPEDVEPLTESIPVQKPKRSLKAALASIKDPPDWNRLEAELSTEIDELISDPHTSEHALQYAIATKRARYQIMLEDATRPARDISMDAEIRQDEFEDDQEVQNCLLPPAEIAKKEKVWVNENKEWLRKMQQKEWKKKMDAKGPKKATRNRVKKPRIGEGQTSAASTPAEAAIGVLKARSWSKKINYEALASMFEDTGGKGKAGKTLGSEATSRVTSRAGSVAGASSVGEEDEEEEREEVARGITQHTTLVRNTMPGKGMPRSADKTSTVEQEGRETTEAQHYSEEDDDEEDQEDTNVEDWKKGLGAAFAADEEDGGDYEEDDYGEGFGDDYNPFTD